MEIAAEMLQDKLATLNAQRMGLGMPMTTCTSTFATLLLAALSLCVSCGGGGAFDEVKGAVKVDGAPVEAGTISLRPVDPGLGGPAGGSISNGTFHAVAREKLRPGKYTVVVQASKRTGRTIKDPQRGPVEEMAPLVLTDMPKEVDLSAENAQNLSIEFHTRGG